MARLSDITNRIIVLLGTEASLTPDEVNSLVQTRYEHIYEIWSWSKRPRDFTISLTPQRDSDASTTVTVTNSSATVTALGTPFTTAMTGAQFQVGAERQYFFVKFVSASTVLLQDGEGNDLLWPGATASGQSWRLYKTIYTLPTDAGSIISLVGTYPIDELDGGRTRLDEMDPDRQTTNDHPNYWLYAGANSQAFTREIELWPVPTQARLLRGQYNRKAPDLKPNSLIDLPIPLLVYSGAADACHLLHAKQGSEETMWENKALFFERKAEEVRKDFEIVELELTSPPTHIGRSSQDRHSQFAGTDYEVSHHLERP